jgi:hypothetical protein
MESGRHEFTIFSLGESMIGELAFRSLLNRHFLSLQTLSLEGCRGFTSKMALEIMTQCSNLINFEGRTMEACDILGIIMNKDEKEEEEATGGGKVVDQQPQEWVCTNLRNLNIFICEFQDKPQDWNRRVLQQLTKLSKLETLFLGSSKVIHSRKHDVRDGLDLR